LRRRPRRRLLAAGGASAVVQIFDLSSRALLRQLHGHRQAVRVACFSPGGAAQQLLSASDDRTLRLWDVALGHCLRVLPGHADAVRAAVPLGDGAGGGQLWLSGSYDHAVRLWDARCPAASATVLALDHGAPVEAALVVGGGALAVSAGGTALRVWDLAGGGRLLHHDASPARDGGHARTITALGDAPASRRVLSGSLDGHVKVYDPTDGRVAHDLRFDAPILCLAVSPDERHLVAGMSNGFFTARRRRRAPEASLLPAAAAPIASLCAGWAASQAATTTRWRRRRRRQGSGGASGACGRTTPCCASSATGLRSTRRLRAASAPWWPSPCWRSWSGGTG
jgi:U3 small nucleolar RNA-associated protein 15